eukprot:SAG31_NODE_2443_length_5682_cov_3.662428_1_plen_114_part_00
MKSPLHTLECPQCYKSFEKLFGATSRVACGRRSPVRYESITAVIDPAGAPTGSPAGTALGHCTWVLYLHSQQVPVLEFGIKFSKFIGLTLTCPYLGTRFKCFITQVLFKGWVV